MTTKIYGSIRPLAFTMAGLSVLLFGWGLKIYFLWLIYYLGCY